MRKIILLFVIILTSNLASSQIKKKKSTVKSVRYSEEKALELMQTRQQLYDLTDYEHYNQFDQNIFNFKIK